MAQASYDQVILDHYKEVATSQGDSPLATMADKRTRQMETELISTFLERALKHLADNGRLPESVTVCDVGCGNGYTLEVLKERYPEPRFVGLEYSPELRAIAESRFQRTSVMVQSADIRDRATMEMHVPDIVICQRVIINLLDEDDQAHARDNIVAIAAPGAQLLFLECFLSGLDALNVARAEFDLEPLPPAHHNLYLEDGFFEMPGLGRWVGPENVIQSNFLSTHYYVTRVLHPLLLGRKQFKRNSSFVSFMSQALRQNVGDFSPIRALPFSKAV
jgi:SAM-dependent methyltransferase